MADPDLQIRGGEGGHPDPKIRGAVLKNFFSTFQASVWSKNNVEARAPGPLPLDPLPVATELPTKSKNSIQILSRSK